MGSWLGSIIGRAGGWIAEGTLAKLVLEDTMRKEAEGDADAMDVIRWAEEKRSWGCSIVDCAKRVAVNAAAFATEKAVADVASRTIHDVAETTTIGKVVNRFEQASQEDQKKVGGTIIECAASVVACATASIATDMIIGSVVPQRASKTPPSEDPDTIAQEISNWYWMCERIEMYVWAPTRVVLFTAAATAVELAIEQAVKYMIKRGLRSCLFLIPGGQVVIALDEATRIYKVVRVGRRLFKGIF